MSENYKYTPEQLASLSKERPRNETDRRFVLSPEEFSKERFLAVKTEVAEMQDKHPEVLSLCMFGSMVKGTAHEGSDIDGWLFVDSELISKKENIPEDEVLRQHEVRNQTYLSEDFNKKYTQEFRDGLREKTGLSDKDVDSIRSVPISEKVINNEIATLLGYYTSYEKFKTDGDEWSKNRPPRGSEIDQLIAHEKARPQRPEHISPSLGGMFHLDVGGGIKMYRKMFIDKISQLGADGEKIWKDTIMGTEMMENNLSLDSTKRYPRTLNDAVKLYS